MCILCKVLKLRLWLVKKWESTNTQKNAIFFKEYTSKTKQGKETGFQALKKRHFKINFDLFVFEKIYIFNIRATPENKGI